MADSGAVAADVTLVAVGMSAAALCCNLVISSALRLSLNAKYLVAGVRCIAQLTLLGAVLKPILEQQQPWMVFGWMAVMYMASTMGELSDDHEDVDGTMSQHQLQRLGCHLICHSYSLQQTGM